MLGDIQSHFWIVPLLGPHTLLMVFDRSPKKHPLGSLANVAIQSGDRWEDTSPLMKLLQFHLHMPPSRTGMGPRIPTSHPFRWSCDMGLREFPCRTNVFITSRTHPESLNVPFLG